jgi:hypothetical protein
MPPTMKMFLANGNNTFEQMSSFSAVNSVPKTLPKPSSLNSSMIGRIHNAKSGCGSCGRK